MINRSRNAVAIACALVMFAGCAGRTPSTKRAEAVIQKYFKKYGKKYPETAFGQYPVKRVEVTSISEIHRSYVGVEAFLTLGSGDLRKINATLEKKALAWKFDSWENPEGM